MSFSLRENNVNDLEIMGQWNASTNTPTLGDSGLGGIKGQFYIVSVAGTTSLDGISSWAEGDWVLNLGGSWVKQACSAGGVASVAGKTGAVILYKADISNFTEADYVHVTGDETVAGIKTFSSFPVTPSAAPTTNYQVANKKYIDDLFSGLGTAAQEDTTAFEAAGSITTHAGLQNVHGLNITAGKTLTVSDNVSITAPLGSAAYAASSTFLTAAGVAGGRTVYGGTQTNESITIRASEAASNTGTIYLSSAVLNIPNSTASRIMSTDSSKNVAYLATTGSGNVVRADGATLTTPTLGVAAATSINKVAITAPATSATLTIADGKTLTANNTLTFSGTDGSTLNVGAGGTLTGVAFSSLGFGLQLVDGILSNTQAASSTAGRIYYLDADASDITGYYEALTVPSVHAESTLNTTAPTSGLPTLIRAFATASGQPNVTSLPAGTAHRYAYAKVSTGSAQIRADLLKRSVADVATTGALTNLTYSATAKTITRAAGNFVTDGFTRGAQITVAGSTSNNGTYTIQSVSILTITLIQTDVLVNEGPNANGTITTKEVLLRTGSSATFANTTVALQMWQYMDDQSHELLTTDRLVFKWWAIRVSGVNPVVTTYYEGDSHASYIQTTITNNAVTQVGASGTQGVTASVTNPTTTPSIAIGLGAITPTSVSLPASQAGAGNFPLKFASSSTPLTTPEAGAMENIDNSIWFTGLLRENLVSNFYVSVAQAKIQSSTSDGTLLGTPATGTTLTLPANYMNKVGRCVRMKQRGNYTTKASGAGTLTLTPKIGSVSLSQGYTLTLPNNITWGSWEAEWEIVTRTTGATGTVYSLGRCTLFGLNGVGIAVTQYFYASSTATVDLTASNTLDMLGRFDVNDSNNYFGCELATGERLR